MKEKDPMLPKSENFKPLAFKKKFNPCDTQHHVHIPYNRGYRIMIEDHARSYKTSIMLCEECMETFLCTVLSVEFGDLAELFNQFKTHLPKDCTKSHGAQIQGNKGFFLYVYNDGKRYQLTNVMCKDCMFDFLRLIFNGSKIISEPFKPVAIECFPDAWREIVR